MSLATEIHSQPEILRNSFKHNLDVVNHIAAELRRHPIEYAFIAARGTSDNAARYAKYIWGAFNQFPVALATPSLFSLYGRAPQLAGALVIGISQSGQSPDIVQVIREGGQQGRPTLAITNDAASPLAQAADYVIDIQAGPEKAVAATKTYTAQLLALAMLSAALSGSGEQMAQISQVPAWVTAVLADADLISQCAPRYRYMDQCIVLGRGYNYATAFEWSLKLKELTYVVAEPYSSADFRHGPIAVVGDGFPVLAVAPEGAVYPDMLALLQKLRTEYRAELLVISNRPEALNLATSPIRLPPVIPEWLTPIISIVPCQLFSYALTAVKGYDTERPRGLQKVTRTT